MSVCLCIASRGRHQLLAHTLRTTLRNAVRDDTRILVALDDDDIPVRTPSDDQRVAVNFAPRDLTLGAKYNRAYEAVPFADLCLHEAAPPANLFVPFVDAVGIVTPGWDQILVDAAAQFDDGIGAVYFGEKRDALALPRMTSLTRKFIDIQGFFMPDGWPFWWYDTHTHEVSYLSGRHVYADVQLEPTPPAKKTRGAREITFWANAYYDLRQERYDIARRVIAASNYSAWQKSTLMQNIEYWGEILNSREAQTTRDPQWAAAYEAGHGFDAPPDERYTRAKRAMIERLGRVQMREAAE